MDVESPVTNGSGAWSDLHGFVYRNLRKRGLSHFDAEDVAQDVLETAYVHRDSVEPGRRHAWVLIVMRNKLADRARRSEQRVRSVPQVPEPNDPTLGPDEIAIQSADRGMLLDAIGRLPERDRRLVEVRYLEDRTVAETAEILGMSPGATKVALYRARDRLRVLLEAAGIAGEAASGIGPRAIRVLTPYVGASLADTFVRGTAVGLGKGLDELTVQDIGALEDRARRALEALLPPDAIERVIAEIQGGSL
jgi:RNA polymerase sigma-70 factor, ECF subfamily